MTKYTHCLKWALLLLSTRQRWITSGGFTIFLWLKIDVENRQVPNKFMYGTSAMYSEKNEKKSIL